MITFSSLILRCFSDENIDFLTFAKLQKIQQPSRKELIFHIRNHSVTKKFYINISPDCFHLCFTNDETLKLRDIEIPKNPPMFCMLLRKYIENAKIVRIDVPDYERILELYFENYDELGEKIELCLAIELMGKHSNIILYNTKNKIIYGCMHNVGEDKSQVRELMGGLTYVYPPKKKKKNFLKTSKQEFELNKDCAENRYYYLTSKILQDANYDYDKILQMIYEPQIYANKEDYSFFKKSDDYKKIDFNSAIDFYYSNYQNAVILKGLKSNLRTFISKNIKKQETLLQKLEVEEHKISDSKQYKLYGDLILANLYKINPNDDLIKVVDYETGKEIEIELENTISPSQNAQKYYKLYSKAKTAKAYTDERITEIKDYLDYLKEADLSVDLANDVKDLKELKQMFVKFDFHNKKETVKIEKTSINGFDVYIGKNHFQNDYLLSKIASPNDVWVHLKDIPSAHIIIKKQEKNIDEQTIFETAKIVKSLSKAKNSSKVIAIYTLKKFVRKIPKSKYGLVNYKEEKEIVLD